MGKGGTMSTIEQTPEQEPEPVEPDETPEPETSDN